MIVAQIGIAVFGVSAVVLSQSANPRVQRYACIAGLAGQPFWLAETASEGQWGIVGMVALYTASWAWGFYNHWIKPWRAAR